MGTSIETITLFVAALLLGLSAGFFYAWQVSVIPGTRQVTDMQYLATMQSINRAILNPAFFIVFFGALIVTGVSTIQQYQSGLTFWLMLAAAVTYLAGTFGVTAAGNVPLNNTLDAMTLGELAADRIAEFRMQYETQWNRLHTIRTGFAILAFMLALAAALTYTKSI